MKQQGDKQVYTVGEVNRKARMVLEGSLGELWVEGELSRVTLHSSGHWYFTLKDAQSAVSCAMFARDNAAVLFRPKDGLQVQMLARPSLFEASGRYQLIASKMEEAGKGNLQAQFEALKAKLAAEGLFDPARKKPLPLLPRRIGVVTSPTGAAIRDILNVLTRRFPNVEILLAPVVVQGTNAARSIVAAIEFLNTQTKKVGQASCLSPVEESKWFTPFLPVEIEKRHMPHWTQEEVTYFVTFRLADSLPEKKLTQWRDEREQWLQEHKEPYSADELSEYAELFSERINRWLDAGSGSCILEQPECASVVEGALLHFEGERYQLGSYVIMKNHVHVLIKPEHGFALSEILHSWKSFSALELNKLTGSAGPVWQDESYDHIVRSPKQYAHYVEYIGKNVEQSGGRAPARVERGSELLGNLASGDRQDACPTLDLLIVGRGGGSIEDLWGFNEEVVARAIAASEIPVISAVGHEIDFTIADFVADVRAPTPSAAAELAVPVKAELEERILRLERRLKQSLLSKEQQLRLRLNRAAHSYVFREPVTMVKQYRQTVAALETRMAHLLESSVRQAQQRVDELGMQLNHRAERKLTAHRQMVERLESQLRMLNPLAVLGRGYSLTRLKDGRVVRSIEDLRAGEELQTQLPDGTAISEVRLVEPLVE